PGLQLALIDAPQVALFRIEGGDERQRRLLAGLHSRRRGQRPVLSWSTERHDRVVLVGSLPSERDRLPSRRKDLFHACPRRRRQGALLADHGVCGLALLEGVREPTDRLLQDGKEGDADRPIRPGPRDGTGVEEHAAGAEPLLDQRRSAVVVGSERVSLALRLEQRVPEGARALQALALRRTEDVEQGVRPFDQSEAGGVLLRSLRSRL